MRRGHGIFLAVLCLSLCRCADYEYRIERVRSAGEVEVQYTVKDSATGFTLKLLYPNDEQVTGTGRVEAVCREAVPLAASQIASCKGRPIRPIDPRRLKMTTTKKGSLSPETCEVTVAVDFVR